MCFIKKVKSGMRIVFIFLYLLLINLTYPYNEIIKVVKNENDSFIKVNDIPLKYGVTNYSIYYDPNHVENKVYLIKGAENERYIYSKNFIGKSNIYFVIDNKTKYIENDGSGIDEEGPLFYYNITLDIISTTKKEIVIPIDNIYDYLKEKGFKNVSADVPICVMNKKLYLKLPYDFVTPNVIVKKTSKKKIQLEGATTSKNQFTFATVFEKGSTRVVFKTDDLTVYDSGFFKFMDSTFNYPLQRYNLLMVFYKDGEYTIYINGLIKKLNSFKHQTRIYFNKNIYYISPFYEPKLYNIMEVIEGVYLQKDGIYNMEPLEPFIKRVYEGVATIKPKRVSILLKPEGPVPLDGNCNIENGTIIKVENPQDTVIKVDLPATEILKYYNPVFVNYDILRVMKEFPFVFNIEGARKIKFKNKKSDTFYIIKKDGTLEKVIIKGSKWDVPKDAVLLLSKDKDLKLSIEDNTLTIVVNNPNNYDLKDFQVKIPLTRAVNGDQVFDFYDDFNDGNWQNRWEIIRGNNKEVFVENKKLILDGTGPTSGGTTVRTKEELNLPNRIRIEGLVYAYDWDEWVGFIVSPTNDINTQNSHGFDDGYDFGYWGWKGSDHSTRTWVNGDAKIGDHDSYDGFFTAQNNHYYFVGGAYSGDTLFHYKPTSNIDEVQYDHSRQDKIYSNQNWRRIFLMVWDGAKWGYEWVRVRKYTDQEPTVTVNGDQIVINSKDNLQEFQVRIPINHMIYDIITENGDSIPFCFEHSNGECDNKPEDIKAIWIKANLTEGKNIFKIQKTPQNLVISDENGNKVNYCFEQSNGECNKNPSNVIWVKVPFIPANGNTELKLKISNTNGAVNGDKVFDFYDNLNNFNLPIAYLPGAHNPRIDGDNYYWWDAGKDAFDRYGYSFIYFNPGSSGSSTQIYLKDGNSGNKLRYITGLNNYRFFIYQDWSNSYRALREIIIVCENNNENYNHYFSFYRYGDLGSDGSTHIYYYNFYWNGNNLRFVYSYDWSYWASLGDPNIFYFMLGDNINEQDSDYGYYYYSRNNDELYEYYYRFKRFLITYLAPSDSYVEEFRNFLQSDLDYIYNYLKKHRFYCTNNKLRVRKYADKEVKVEIRKKEETLKTSDFYPILPYYSFSFLTDFSNKWKVYEGILQVKVEASKEGGPSNKQEFDQFITDKLMDSNIVDKIFFEWNSYEKQYENYINFFLTYFYIDNEKKICFGIDGDDAIELFIDNRLILSWEGLHAKYGRPYKTRCISLNKGWHKLVMRQEENHGYDNVFLYYRFENENEWKSFSLDNLKKDHIILRTFYFSNEDIKKVLTLDEEPYMTFLIKINKEVHNIKLFSEEELKIKPTDPKERILQVFDYIANPDIGFPNFLPCSNKNQVNNIISMKGGYGCYDNDILEPYTFKESGNYIILGKYYFVDSWDGEEGYIKVGNTKVYSKNKINYGVAHKNYVGNDRFEEEFPLNKNIVYAIFHANKNDKLTIGSSLNQNSYDESYGIGWLGIAKYDDTKVYITELESVQKSRARKLLKVNTSKIKSYKKYIKIKDVYISPTKEAYKGDDYISVSTIVDSNAHNIFKKLVINGKTIEGATINPLKDYLPEGKNNLQKVIAYFVYEGFKVGDIKDTNKTIITDYTSPNIDIFPENFTVKEGNKLTFRYKVTDNYNGDLICEVNGITKKLKQNKTYYYTIDVPLGVNNVTLKVECKDKALNKGEKTESILVTSLKKIPKIKNDNNQASKYKKYIFIFKTDRGVYEYKVKENKERSFLVIGALKEIDLKAIGLTNSTRHYINPSFSQAMYTAIEGKGNDVLLKINKSKFSDNVLLILTTKVGDEELQVEKANISNGYIVTTLTKDKCYRVTLINGTKVIDNGKLCYDGEEVIDVSDKIRFIKVYIEGIKKSKYSYKIMPDNPIFKKNFLILTNENSLILDIEPKDYLKVGGKTYGYIFNYNTTLEFDRDAPLKDDPYEYTITLKSPHGNLSKSIKIVIYKRYDIEVNEKDNLYAGIIPIDAKIKIKGDVFVKPNTEKEGIFMESLIKDQEGNQIFYTKLLDSLEEGHNPFSLTVPLKDYRKYLGQKCTLIIRIINPHINKTAIKNGVIIKRFRIVESEDYTPLLKYLLLFGEEHLKNIYPILREKYGYYENWDEIKIKLQKLAEKYKEDKEKIKGSRVQEIKEAIS